jgi:hypothetical protein
MTKKIKKFTEDELKNSKRIYKSATPKYTVDWYIKWVASITLLFGMILTANNIYPFNIFVHMIGLIGWLVVSLMWNDRALIVINAVGIAIMANGLVGYFVESGIWQ